MQHPQSGRWWQAERLHGSGVGEQDGERPVRRGWDLKAVEAVACPLRSRRTLNQASQPVPSSKHRPSTQDFGAGKKTACTGRRCAHCATAGSTNGATMPRCVKSANCWLAEFARCAAQGRYGASGATSRRQPQAAQRQVHVVQRVQQTGWGFRSNQSRGHEKIEPTRFRS